MITAALQDRTPWGQSLQGKSVFYVAPTFEQAKRNIWLLLKELLGDIPYEAHENTGVITLPNGCRIELHGADRPDSMRGVGLRFVVLDEYADMKPHVWEAVIRPALSDVRGGALFIGTPKGLNHFYRLWTDAHDGILGAEYAAFVFKSAENPFLASAEVDAWRRDTSTEIARQEYEAEFFEPGSGAFKSQWLKYDDREPVSGFYIVTMDPAGFADPSKTNTPQSRIDKLDRSAIATIKINGENWWVKNFEVGRWGIEETARRFVDQVAAVKPMAAGIERGALRNAVMGYVDGLMRSRRVFATVSAITYPSGRDKTERIIWSLQGRFERSLITLNRGEWNKDFESEYLAFPSRGVHDDMLDALSFAEQLSQGVPFDVDMYHPNEYSPLDVESGF